MTALMSWIGNCVRWASRWSVSIDSIPKDSGGSTLPTYLQSLVSKSKVEYGQMAGTPEEKDSPRTASNTPSLPYWGGALSGLLRDRSETAWLWDGSSGRWQRFDWLEPT